MNSLGRQCLLMEQRAGMCTELEDNVPFFAKDRQVYLLPIKIWVL